MLAKTKAKKTQRQEADASTEWVRVQFELAKPWLDELDAFVRESGLRTRSDLLRRALGLYGHYLDAKRRNARFGALEEDGKFRSMEII